MEARVSASAAQRPGLAIGQKWLLAAACVVAGAAPLAARWIFADAAARVAYGLLVAAVYLAFTLVARRSSALRPYWELSFAFFVLAVVQVLNNYLPGYVGTSLLHDPPNAGDPLASTIAGTVVIQLLETAIAVIPVVGLTALSERNLGSIYVRSGKLGRWLVLAVVFFVVVFLYLATLTLRPDSPARQLLPTNGALTLAHFLTLTPALMVVAIANGFEEEFLFRGLFLPKYNAFFGFGVANLLQALVFTIAHVGITYTPVALLFLVAWVFPLGLITGFLMRKSDGILAPAIFHAGLDLAIYVAFLSYAT